jgi:hypothetical protein
MRKLAITLGLLVAVAAIAVAQAVPCKGLREKRPYCPTEKKVLDAKTEVKSGKCLKDEAKVEQVDVCVLTSYTFGCHPSKEAKKGAS